MGRQSLLHAVVGHLRTEVTSGALTLSVVPDSGPLAAVLPAEYPYYVTLGEDTGRAETVMVTGAAGSSPVVLTVLRGQLGTIPAAHPADEAVVLSITASELAQLLARYRQGAERAAVMLGSGVRREPYFRGLGGSNLGTAFSGQMILVGLPLYAGDVITSLTYLSGSNGAVFGSNNDGHLWFALYGPDRVLIAQTADQGVGTPWPANTKLTLPLTTPQVIPATGLYYVGVMVNAGTGGAPAAPDVRGWPASTTQVIDSAGWPAGVPMLGASNGAGLGAAAPAGPITLSPFSFLCYCIAS
jgi:hypothetical protein